MKKIRQSRSQKKVPRWTGKRSFKNRMADLGLGLAGVGVAAVSSYLPYYVYNNANEFGPPKMAFTGRSLSAEELADQEVDEITVSSIRQPLFQNEEQDIDPVVTGSVRIVKPVAQKNQARIIQESDPSILPRKSGPQTGLRLIFATHGRALVRDGDDLFPVGIGSRLPNGSTVRSVTRSDNRWTLLTSSNQLLELSN